MGQEIRLGLVPNASQIPRGSEGTRSLLWQCGQRNSSCLMSSGLLTFNWSEYQSVVGLLVWRCAEDTGFYNPASDSC